MTSLSVQSYHPKKVIPALFLPDRSKILMSRVDGSGVEEGQLRS